MISLHDNCLFVHIPKVAGQSIESVFLQRAGLDWDSRAAMLLKPNRDPKKGPPRLAHLTYSEYVQLGYLSQKEIAHLYSFAFVRNPWQRILSEYQYRDYQCSFDDFLLKRFPTIAQDNFSNGDDLFRHVIPQAEFVFDRYDNQQVDFIGRFETLTADFAKVTKTITGSSLSLPHKNKTSKSLLERFIRPKKRHYTEYFSDKGEAFVARYYARDIALFNYQFGL